MSEVPYHEINGTQYPRVTSILSILREPGLEAWRERIGDDAADAKARAAARIGTALHKRIEVFLRGKKMPVTKSAQLQRAWSAWQQWWMCQTGEVRAAMQSWRTQQETLRWRDTPWGGYSGTPDLVMHNPRTIVDWKCASRIRESHFLQLHFYVALVWPEHQPPTTLVVVRIDPDLGMFQEERREFDPAILEDCYALLRVYRRWYFDAYLARAAREKEMTVMHGD